MDRTHAVQSILTRNVKADPCASVDQNQIASRIAGIDSIADAVFCISPHEALYSGFGCRGFRSKKRHARARGTEH